MQGFEEIMLLEQKLTSDKAKADNDRCSALEKAAVHAASIALAGRSDVTHLQPGFERAVLA